MNKQEKWMDKAPTRGAPEPVSSPYDRTQSLSEQEALQFAKYLGRKAAIETSEMRLKAKDKKN